MIMGMQCHRKTLNPMFAHPAIHPVLYTQMQIDRNNLGVMIRVLLLRGEIKICCKKCWLQFQDL